MTRGWSAWDAVASPSCEKVPWRMWFWGEIVAGKKYYLLFWKGGAVHSQRVVEREQPTNQATTHRYKWMDKIAADKID